jgi:ABC-type molybdenum transport system ATPase subunit/photorepair protein PhrA
MDPITAGVMVGGSALTSWMNAQAQAKMAAEQRKLEGQMMAQQQQSKGVSDMSQGQQQNLAQLMSAYRSILG